MAVLNAAAVNAATVAAVAHKHAKHQEDQAKSCTTYQNLIFEDGTARTEPIIVCDVDKPVVEQQPALFTSSALCFYLIVAFVFGFVVCTFIKRTW